MTETEKKVDEAKERVEKELDELNEKIVKLTSFLYGRSRDTPLFCKGGSKSGARAMRS